jgi:hypothetical protein
MKDDAGDTNGRGTSGEGRGAAGKSKRDGRRRPPVLQCALPCFLVWPFLSVRVIFSKPHAPPQPHTHAEAAFIRTGLHSEARGAMCNGQNASTSYQNEI